MLAVYNSNETHTVLVITNSDSITSTTKEITYASYMFLITTMFAILLRSTSIAVKPVVVLFLL